MATYFGEVTELNSRAVWYSDEEDDDDEDLLDFGDPLEPVNHEIIRSKLSLCFERFLPPPAIEIDECIISLVSTAQYKNFKTNDTSISPIGQYKNLAKVFLCSLDSQGVSTARPQVTLWLMCDQSTPLVTGIEVSYLVEVLREKLYSELALSPSCPVYILAKQYSNDQHLSYLSNLATNSVKLQTPFIGSPTIPPLIVRNKFESALFEQLTLTLKLAYVVFLPDPKNYWFDKALCWPKIPTQIIEQRLYDDSLDKTLIFT